RLERGGDVGDLLAGEMPVTLDVERDRRLDSAEGKVGGPVGHVRERERDRLRVARGRRGLDDRPAGEAEAEELRDLVERLARRVVARLADQRVLERRPRVVERGVAARA